MDQFPHDTETALSAADFTGQRHESRDSLLLTAQMRFVGSDRIENVRVRNLSAGGLMAEFAGPLAAKAPVEIEVRGVGWVRGSIAWTAEGRVGIAFDNAIDPMLARKPVGKGTTTPHYVKPILTRR